MPRTAEQEDNREKQARQFHGQENAPDPAFRRIAALAAAALNVPIAVLCLREEAGLRVVSATGMVPGADRVGALYDLVPGTGDSIIVPDASADGSLREHPLAAGEPHARFIAQARLTNANGLDLGTLTVLDRKARPGAGAREEAILRDLAATTVELVEQGLRPSRNQLRILSRASRTLNSVLETRAVLHTLVVSAMELAGASSGMAGLVENGRVVFREAHLDGTAKPVDLNFGPGEGAAGRVIETGKPYLLNVATRTLLCIPIFGRDGSILGCLELHDSRSPGGFDERDVEILEDLAAAAGTAIENAATLHRQTQTEASLRQTRDELEAAVQTSPLALVSLDPEGRVTRWNAAAEQMFGWTAAETIGRLYPISGDDNLPQFLELRDRVLAGEVVDGIELRRRARWGQEITVRVHAEPLRDASGRITGIMAALADVTRQRRVEEALRRSEEHVRLAIESSPAGMVTLDLDGCLRSANPAFCEMLGYVESDLLGMPLDRFTHSNASEPASTRFQALLAGRVSSCEYDQRYVRKDGIVILAAIRAALVRDAAGSPLFVLATAADITARKRAEEALLHSEERYRNMVESSPDAIFIHSAGRIVFANAALLQLIAAGSPAQVLGKPAFELLHPHYHDIVRRRVGELLASSARAPWIEEKFVRLDGSTVDVEAAAFQVVFDAGPAVQVVARDITERKRAQKELLRFEAIIQGTDEAIISYELDGTIASWNPGAERLYGYIAEEMIGQPYSIFLTSAQWESVNDMATSGEHFTSPREMTRRRSDGVEIRFSLTASLNRDPAGQPYGISTIAHDMTESRKRENEIRIMNRFLHQLSGQLLTSQDDERRRIARELHDSTAQTLAAVAMNLALVRNLSNPMDSSLRQTIEETLALAEQCSQELRSISYLLHPPLLDELGLVSALRSFMEGFTARTAIKVTLQTAPDLGRLSSAVEMTIFRIVQEGLANVHRHSGSRSASIQLRKLPEGIELIMQDRGRGLPPEVLSPGASGTRFGVGILGMRERAIQLGGRLDIESCGEGTTILVLLPWSPSDEPVADSHRR